MSWDRVGHVGLWFVFTVVCRSGWRSRWWAYGFVVWFGVAAELLQPVVGRSATPGDVVADLVGTAAAAVVVELGVGLRHRWFTGRLRR